jgi:uncharacterized membrane protein YedE/YeeE
MNTAQWTDKIPDTVICNYFYVFFCIFAVWAALSLLGGVWIFATTKMSLGVLVGVIFNILLSFGISATSALFLYLICERALKPSMGGKVRNATSQIATASDYEMM